VSGPSPDLVTVRTFANQVEADLAASWLAAEGVESMVVADDAGGALPSFDAVFGVKLCVLAGDEARAREILDSAEKDAESPEESPEE